MATKTRRDPVTQYATDVCAGKIVASLLVRKACARHLDDLTRQAEKSITWNPARAQEAIDFFPEVLCLPEETDSDDDADEDSDREPKAGTPFVLSPWQQFIVGSLMGWFAYRTNKKGVKRLVRRFRVAFLLSGKGSGKTPIFAGLLIYLLVADGERGAQMFCAAVTKDQARLAYADCEKMVAASPHLKQLIDRKVNNLAVLETGSFIRPISSEKRGLDGKRVHAAVIDEEHEHPSDVVYLKMRAGTKGRRNALIMIPTNAGFDRETVCGRHYEYSRQVLDGTVTNESWFAFVCHLDPCAACAERGQIQPSDDCPDCDDWTTEGPHWLKANPNLGVSLPWQYLREQVREAIDIPAQQNMVRRLNFCHWTSAHTVWIPAEQWDACRSTIERPTSGVPCAFAFDMSMKVDLTGGVAAQRFDDPKDVAPSVVETEDVEQGEAVTKKWAVNYRIKLSAFAWIPEDTLQERERNEQIPYSAWVKLAKQSAGPSGQPFLEATPGPVIDHHLIEERFLQRIGPTYKPQRVGYDPYNATELAVALRDRGKYTVVEVGQGRKLSEYIKLFYALVRLGRIEHDGNPLFAWCVANAEPKYDRYENVWLEKPSGGKRIDLAIAAVMAVSQVVLLPTPRQGSRGVLKVFTPSAFVPMQDGGPDARA